MALTVGELVAYIRADGTQFDRQIDDSGRKFTGFSTMVQAGVKTAATMFAGVTGTVTGLGVALFKVGSDYNRLQQSSRAALSTLLGGAEAANAQMDKLDAFARNSPFAKQVFIVAQQQLLGFGLAADKVLPTLDAIQNAVAATGGSNTEIERVTYSLAQMQGQGKLTGETLNQLGQYGIDAAGIIGARMGKTGAEIRDMASKPGGIPADQIWDDLVTGLMDRFGGATAGIKAQFDGAADRVKGAWRDIGSTIAAPFIDPNGGGRAVEWANKVADALRALEQKAKPLVDLLLQRFKPGLDAVTPSLDKVRGAINSWDLSKVNGQLDTLAKYAPLIAPVAAGLAALGGSQILGPLARLVPGLKPVVAAVAALIASSPELRQMGGEFLTALQPLIPVAADLGKILADSLLRTLEILAPSARDLLVAGADVAVMFGTGLAPAVVAVADALGPVATVVANVVSWVAQLPAPVLGAVAAFIALRTLGVPGLVGGITTKIQGLVTAAKGLSFSGIGSSLMSAFGGPIGIAIAGITAAITYFANESAEAKRKADELTDSLDQQTGALGENTRELVYNRLEAAGVFEATARAGLDATTVLEAALDGQSAAAETVRAKLAEVRDAYQDAIDTGDQPRTYSIGGREEFAQYNDLTRAIEEVVGVQDDVVNGGEAIRRKQETLGGSLDNTTGKTRDQADALKELTDAQREAAGASISLREAQLQVEDQQQRFNEAVAQSAKVNADAEASEEAKAAAVRDVEQALLTTVRGYQQTTDAMVKNNASGTDLNKVIQQQRDKFIENAMQMGKTKFEAEQLANAYGLIPNRVDTKVFANTDEAIAKVDTLVRTINGRTATIKVYTENSGTTGTIVGSGVKFNRDGGMLEFFASGAMRSLTPMSSVAQIVGANTWRVIGDRPRGDEAYIPIENTARSHAIFDETARRLGRLVLPMDAGGVLAQSPSAAAVPSNPAVAPTVLAPESVRHLARELAQVAAGLSQAAVAGAARSAGSERATRGTAW
ncbi:MAG: tape measure protein [Salana multivorans]|nr:tape measure protein [Salana multivorans]